MNWPDDYIISSGGRRNGVVIIRCRNCDSPYKIYKSRLNQNRGQFCGRSCRGKYLMQGKILKPESKVKKVCPVCSKIFIKYQSQSKNETCSNECRYVLHATKISGEKHPFWKGGRYPGWRGLGWQKKRLVVRSKQNLKCFLCGKTEHANKRQLDVHHKKPYRNSKNSSLNNLIALCRSCHMKEERCL